MAPRLAILETAQERDRAVAAAIAARLASALSLRGRASLVVSGGRTPLGAFARLSLAPLDWERVAVTLADERWVPPSHEDSNERCVRDHLLRNAAAAARFVPLKTAASTPEAGAGAAAAGLAGIARPFDVTLLGMGEDAHTASLFPGAPELAAALDPRAPAPCIAVNPPRAPHARLSLTLRAILDSRVVMVEIAGAAKRAAIERALGPGEVAAMPIRAVLRQPDVPVEVFWSP